MDLGPAGRHLRFGYTCSFTGRSNAVVARSFPPMTVCMRSGSFIHFCGRKGEKPAAGRHSGQVGLPLCFVSDRCGVAGQACAVPGAFCGFLRLSANEPGVLESSEARERQTTPPRPLLPLLFHVTLTYQHNVDVENMKRAS